MRVFILITSIALSVQIVIGQKVELSNYSKQFGITPVGKNDKIFAPGLVSTMAYNHASISFSPGCDEMYWSSEDEQSGHRVIWYSRVMEGSWSTPQILDITKEFDGDCPILSPDGKRLYFLSNRPLKSDQNRERERVWYAENGNSGWGKAVALDHSVNGKHLHWQVSVDKEYNIYFGSERSGSKGKDDIFYSEYKNGRYSEPVSLPKTINTVHHESTPFVAPDGSYLLFVWNKYGDDSYPSGLYISYRSKDGVWQESIYLGEDIDCSACPYVSPDGKYLFFKKDGKNFKNVYWVSASCIGSDIHDTK